MQRQQRQKRPLLRRPQLHRLAVDRYLERAKQADLDRHTPLSTRRRPFVYRRLRYLSHVQITRTRPLRRHTHSRGRRQRTSAAAAADPASSSVVLKATLTGPYLHTTATGNRDGNDHVHRHQGLLEIQLQRHRHAQHLGHPHHAAPGRRNPQALGIPVHGDNVHHARLRITRPLGRPRRAEHGRRRSSRTPAAST